MRILLTGGNGFIGKNLVENLTSDYEIVAPLRKQLDLLDEEAVKEYLSKNDFDIIIHTANINTSRNKLNSDYDSLDGNLRMFFNLEKCSELYGRMYYFGSGAEYDMRHYIPYMPEEYFGTYIPEDAYGFSKYIMSKACSQNSKIYDLRLFGVYGKYEEYEHRFISNAICNVLLGKDITIHQNVYYDYLYVEDLADIMRWFIENDPKHKHYNLCRGKKIDLYSLAVMVRDILEVNCDIVVEREGWKKEYSGNNERLLKEIGEYNFSEFKTSIRDLCQWYKLCWNEIDKELLS